MAGKYNFHPKGILENKAQCLTCKDILVSSTRHDFKKCTCGNLCVDGGKDYIKRSLIDAAKYKELSTYRKETID